MTGPDWTPARGELVEVTTGANAGRRGRVLAIHGRTAVIQLPPLRAAYAVEELQPALRSGPWSLR